MLATYYAHTRPSERWPSKADLRIVRPTKKSSSSKEPQLPEEAQQLKNLIRQTHPAKCFTFSLAHLRKIAVPPVEIPEAYSGPRAKSMCVGGRQVPYTREMWKKSKRRYVFRRLDNIYENFEYKSL